MTGKAPPIPPEQRAFPGQKPDVRGERGDHPERAQNLKEQGQAGNIHQNTHHQGHQQDR
jgi:hypothetical protein